MVFVWAVLEILAFFALVMGVIVMVAIVRAIIRNPYEWDRNHEITKLCKRINNNTATEGDRLELENLKKNGRVTISLAIDTRTNTWRERAKLSESALDDVLY